MSFKTRTIEEMRKRSEDIIKRSTDRSTKKEDQPSISEIQLATDNIRLIVLFFEADKLVAYGFMDKWKKLLSEAGGK